MQVGGGNTQTALLKDSKALSCGKCVGPTGGGGIRFLGAKGKKVSVRGRKLTKRRRLGTGANFEKTPSCSRKKQLHPNQK